MHRTLPRSLQPVRSWRWMGLWLLGMAVGGCAPQGSTPVPKSGGTGAAVGTDATVDPWQDAMRAAPRREHVYLTAAKPILDALVARDYAAFHETLSSHARASSKPAQFVAPVEENPRPAAALRNLSVDEFGQWMQKMEAARGIPVKVDQVHVETLNPKILAGQAQGPEEQIDVMYAIGAMPAEIPADIRRASLRARVRCQLSDEQIRQIAEVRQTTPEAIRKEDSEQDEDDRGTYLNFKFVFVEEDGRLKVGYFEFLPPSMMD